MGHNVDLQLLMGLPEKIKCVECNNMVDSFFDGIVMIEKKFKKILEQFQIKEIEALNVEFNPQFHEALFSEESDSVKVETVVEVFQTGYMYKDNVLKPARVKVAKPKK